MLCMCMCSVCVKMSNWRCVFNYSHMAEDLRGRTLNPALIEPLSPVSQKRASARGIKNR